ncbi:MAG: alkaline phosphatase D family protein [Planctomycetota bacterium]|jgi:alkaline phosphatase D
MKRRSVAFGIAAAAGAAVVVGVIVRHSVVAPRTVLAKDCITDGETDPVMVDLSPYLIKALRGSPKGKGGRFGAEGGMPDLVKEPAFQELVRKHGLKLFTGPMVGSIADTSARFWVRTAGPARVQAVVGNPRVARAQMRSSPEVLTRADGDFATVLEVTGLKPFADHTYEVLVDGKASGVAGRPWFRTAPASGAKARFSIAFGGGARYIPKYEHVWETIRRARPLALLLLGDNVYIDEPQRRDIQRLHYYRRHLRHEWRAMAASTAVYGIYDDHDLGKNDCAGGPDPFKPEWKFLSWKVFRENWVNPYYGGGEKRPGCWFGFELGDVHVFMLDNRYYRDFPRTMLGPEQKRWLLDALARSRAKFKVLASGTLWTALADKKGKDSWEAVAHEREEIFGMIDRQRIGGVVLISADRHRTEIWKNERPKGYTLWEFESSRLTNQHKHGTRKEAEWSYNQGRFFGMLDFDLTLRDPTVTLRAVSSEGRDIHSKTLRLSELQVR